MYFFEIRNKAPIFVSYNYFVKKNWLCQTLFLRDSRLTDHYKTQKISNFFLQNLSTLSENLKKIQTFLSIPNFFLSVPRLTDPYESPRVLTFFPTKIFNT